MKKSLAYLPLGILILLWGFTIVHYTDLPDTLPTHFNALGEPDDFGPRSYAFGLPIIASILYVILSFASKTKKVQSDDRKVLLWIQGAVLLIFGYIQVQSFLIALGRSDGLGNGFLPLSGGLILIPILLQRLLKKR